MIAQLCDYATRLWIVQFRSVNFMARELYVNKSHIEKTPGAFCAVGFHEDSRAQEGPGARSQLSLEDGWGAGSKPSTTAALAGC